MAETQKAVPLVDAVKNNNQRLNLMLQLLLLSNIMMTWLVRPLGWKFKPNHETNMKTLLKKIDGLVVNLDKTIEVEDSAHGPQRQTEAEKQNMQFNKGRTRGLCEGRSESISVIRNINEDQEAWSRSEEDASQVTSIRSSGACQPLRTEAREKLIDVLDSATGSTTGTPSRYRFYSRSSRKSVIEEAAKAREIRDESKSDGLMPLTKHNQHTLGIGHRYASSLMDFILDTNANTTVRIKVERQADLDKPTRVFKRIYVEVELQKLNNHTLEEDQTDNEDRTDQDAGDDEDAGIQEIDQPPDLTDYQLITDIRSVLTQRALNFFCETFHIPDEVHPQLPSPNQTIHEMPTGKIGWMSFNKCSGTDAVCYSKPLNLLKGWNDHFFWVDTFACPALFSWHTVKSVSSDAVPKSSEFNAEHYAILVAYPAPFHKYPEPFLCLIGMSRNYFLDENTVTPENLVGSKRLNIRGRYFIDQ
nr:hypothetical protein [Tanacetum cinerariifolium]